VRNNINRKSDISVAEVYANPITNFPTLISLYYPLGKVTSKWFNMQAIYFSCGTTLLRVLVSACFIALYVILLQLVHTKKRKFISDV
jgi:hypothetical protein